MASNTNRSLQAKHARAIMQKIGYALGAQAGTDIHGAMVRSRHMPTSKAELRALIDGMIANDEAPAVHRVKMRAPRAHRTMKPEVKRITAFRAAYTDFAPELVRVTA